MLFSTGRSAGASNRHDGAATGPKLLPAVLRLSSDDTKQETDMTPNSRIIAIAMTLLVAGCGAPDASSDATAACAKTGGPYVSDQPPPGYPDARRGTGERSKYWYVPSTVQKGRWGILCIAN
jgi:hypothetical protein